MKPGDIDGNPRMDAGGKVGLNATTTRCMRIKLRNHPAKADSSHLLLKERSYAKKLYNFHGQQDAQSKEKENNRVLKALLTRSEGRKGER